MNMSVSDLSVGCRFADYFVICGLDFDSGLETDRLSGNFNFSFVFYISCDAYVFVYNNILLK